jgi:hypothetical protein
MKDETIVMYDSPEAAIQKTITGWISRNGHFWADNEHMARWDGCTHIKCSKCGAVITKHGYTVCKKCRHANDAAKYQALPKKPWHGTGMVYSQYADKWFSDWSDIEEYCEAENITPIELQLVHSEASKPPILDPAEFLQDILPEDETDVDDTISAAADAFNKAVKAVHATRPISYWPVKVAVEI